MKKLLYLGLDPSRLNLEGEVVHLPVIKTVSRPYEGKIKLHFESLIHYTHVLFTSRTAVLIFKNYALKAGVTHSVLEKKIYIAIGKSTQQCLEDACLSATFTAAEETAEGVVELLKQINLQGAHLFFPRSAQGRDVIPRFLEKKGIAYTLLDLYDTLPQSATIPNLEQFDAIVFTSPSCVSAFFSCLNQSFPPIEKCLSIGPITQRCLNQFYGKTLEV